MACAEGDGELSGKRTGFRRYSGKQQRGCTEEATGYMDLSSAEGAACTTGWPGQMQAIGFRESFRFEYTERRTSFFVLRSFMRTPARGILLLTQHAGCAGG